MIFRAHCVPQFAPLAWFASPAPQGTLEAMASRRIKRAEVYEVDGRLLATLEPSRGGWETLWRCLTLAAPEWAEGEVGKTSWQPERVLRWSKRIA